MLICVHALSKETELMYSYTDDPVGNGKVSPYVWGRCTED